ncbi:MAG: hypothetical protein GPOALKHO_001289 [Sodalis sp.]|nr:MAG: hypothetical protein GPOALKHO_001289 [Sodalis sp.]
MKKEKASEIVVNLSSLLTGMMTNFIRMTNGGERGSLTFAKLFLNEVISCHFSVDHARIGAAYCPCCENHEDTSQRYYHRL